MRTFLFRRIIKVEEVYSVTMSDGMADANIARNMVVRQLSKDQLTDAVKLTESRIINIGRMSKC